MRKLMIIVLSLMVGASISYSAPVEELTLTISRSGYSYEKTLSRHLLNDKDGLCRRVFATYDNVRKEAKRRGNKDELWRLELTDVRSGKLIFDLHFHGETKPSKRSLYEFVLHLITPEQSQPIEFRVLIDRVTLHNFLWNRREFVEELLEKSHTLVAKKLGYGRATSSTDFRKLVTIDSWRFEIFRFGRNEALYSGTKQDIDGRVTD